MSISGLFGKANLSKLDFTLDIPQEIYAGAPFPLKVTLKNIRKFMPAFLIRLKTDRFGTLFPFVGAGSEFSSYATVSFEKRGLYSIDNPFIHSVFPFNFFTRFKKLQHTFNFIVFPALKPCDLSSLYEQKRRGKSERLSDKIGYESDVVSIREYVRGDPLKYIHWKATARTGKVKTKELSSLTYRPIIIDFERVPIQNMEEKISSIAYTVVQLSKKHIPVGLRINGLFYPPHVSPNHKVSLLRVLALYGIDKKDLNWAIGKVQ
jgi:uncharacterized protein (DUF58 family)